MRIKTNSEESSQLGVGEWLTSATKMTFLNDSSYGNSYIKYDGTTCELLDWYKPREMICSAVHLLSKLWRSK